MEKCYDLVALGELLLRLSSYGTEPLFRGTLLKKYAGGAELNVAAGVASLGLKADIISRIPANPLGRFVARQVTQSGVAADGLIYDGNPGARLGIYFSQSAVSPRKSTVVYDRADSSFTRISVGELPMGLLDCTRLFHTTGITLALGENVRKITETCMKRCKSADALISFDVNFRETLWSEKEARSEMEKILPLVDILFISEETCRRMFGKSDTLSNMQKSFCSEYGISFVFSTERKVISSTEQCFGSTGYDAKAGKTCQEKPYEHIHVVDRIGSGDAYVAGALFGLLKYGRLQEAIRFGNAMAAVKNTISGDLPATDFDEIQSIINSHNAAGIQSEMIR